MCFRLMRLQLVQEQKTGAGKSLFLDAHIAITLNEAMDKVLSLRHRSVRQFRTATHQKV
ncbi:MAG: hypothetical protein ACI8XC_004120 [Gammaproteobacteria bacterium]|jgi:hypothetical protein